MKTIEPTEVLYKGKIYKLKYQHIVEQYDEERDFYYLVAPNNKLCKAMTKCFIRDDNGKELFSSIACCSSHDQFNKRMGRIISSGRLLKKLKREDPNSIFKSGEYWIV